MVNNSTEPNAVEGIAVIGMDGRFPGAKDIETFWQNLCNGVESISFFSDEELLDAGVDAALLQHPDYVKARGVLGETSLFDAAFFGLNPREAALMDPQHRLFLECAWNAFAYAGYRPSHHQGRVGVFAGQSMNTYLLQNLLSHIDMVASAESLQAAIGNDKDSLTTEVAYRLNLTGPAVTIQSSSSTSLVAVHYACQSLLNYECDMALAGGVSIHFPEKAGYFYQEGGTTSIDGHCRAFDAAASGFVAGHGAGVVVLKRLQEAQADGDTIHAVIRGSAVNNDGNAKVSYMAPSVNGQAEVIIMAQAIAGCDAESIGYIEAHGTGTAMGDPIEIEALTTAFRTATAKKGFCALGSLKTNIGHLDTAAGVAGLIKTILILKHRLIPPSLHFEQPNPEIDFANSPFYVNTTLAAWPDDGTPRRAGVSSLGMGGTNAHVILEEAPPTAASGPARAVQLLLLSAKTPTALETMTAELGDYCRHHNTLSLADVAYTLQTGRQRFRHRRILVCHSMDDAATALSSADPERLLTAVAEPQSRAITFMFSGQGAQYMGMGQELYEEEALFRQHVDACAQHLRPHIGLDLRHVLYPDTANWEQATTRLQQTAVAQPALFVVEYALARLWASWGIHPQSMIGHSIGEYVAACLAGVFSLQEALALVAARGQLMQQRPPGAMLAVSLSQEALAPFLDGDYSLAAVNGPANCVVSGTAVAIEALQEALAAEDVGCRWLHTSHAFHSAMMEPILAPFRQQLEAIHFRAPAIPFISNVTGTWITDAEATSPDYWVRHLRQTVHFAAGIGELLQDPDALLLEVGPGHTLGTLARQHPNRQEQVVLSSLRHPKEQRSDLAFLLETAGRLWLSGVEIDWQRDYDGQQRRRLPLPAYPFDRQQYWIEPQRPAEDAQSGRREPDAHAEIASWFSVPSWKQTDHFAATSMVVPPKPGRHWLIFGDAVGIGAQLAPALQQQGHRVSLVTKGPGFTDDDGRYTVDPHVPEAYLRLLAALNASDPAEIAMVYLWSLGDGEPSINIEDPQVVQTAALDSVLFLVQAIGKEIAAVPVQLWVVSNSVYAITGREGLHPAQALVSGLCRVIPQEYPNVTCHHVDIDIGDDSPYLSLAERLLAELAISSPEPSVAWRGPYRWQRSFEPLRLEAQAESPPRLRQQGVYLITGGLGGIGLALARYLAETVQANLVLIGRSGLPPAAAWDEWTATQDGKVRARIKKVQHLQALGAQVFVLAADVGDEAQMQTAVGQAIDRFGDIHGVIHAAGVAGGGMLQNLTPQDFARTLLPKVQGTLVLNKVLAQTELDFFILCSSIASLSGGVGRGDYSAANAFLDAFAYWNYFRDHRNITSINWDTWKEVGMAAEADDVPAGIGKLLQEIVAERGILPAEGMQAFARLLHHHALPQVLVSKYDAKMLAARTEEIILRGKQGDKPGGRSKDEPLHPRPHLQNPYVAPRNELEQKVAEVWQEVLGVQQVGIYDNFFELGGNSLAGVQLVSRLNQALGVEISAVTLYEGPTINTLVELVAPGRPAEPLYEQDRTRGQKRRERMQRRRRRTGH